MFQSTKQYMEAHGTGLGDAETYAVLFYHTPCYDLIPDSARLVVLDSQLTIAKAFKALIYNEIRAAPVWNSQSQSMTAMLTLTDFVNMLNLCWSTSEAGTTEERWTKLEIDDFDKLTIQKWKEFVRSEYNVRITSQNTPTANTCMLTDRPLSRNRIADEDSSLTELVTSCPASNLSSPSGSRSRSSSSSKSLSSTISLPPNLSTVPANNQETSAPKTSVSPANVINGLLRSIGLGSRPTSALFRRLITVDPEDNLLNALRLLSRFRLHHLPVIDCPQQRTGNVLYVLTQRVMLSYLYGKLAHLPQPRFLQVRYH
ncbi:hypothetical protein AHF37_05627 [Paragonimus kellicotti]|nr:hypothetical protein AHF37_05627 [Paragonimus kellicotti]